MAASLSRSRSAGLPRAYLGVRDIPSVGFGPLSWGCPLAPAIFHFLGMISQAGFSGGEAMGASSRTGFRSQENS